MTAEVRGEAGARVSSLDTLRAALVAWIIGGHALLGYSAVGGWAYDEVNEVTFAPAVEYGLTVLLGPSALFLMGTFFLVAGLLTPASLARKGPARFARDRSRRLGVPFVASMLLVWPLFLWLAYLAAGQDVGYWWLLTGRERTLDSGALWFAEVLLIFSLAYLLWRVFRSRRESRPAARPPLRSADLLWWVVGIAVAGFVVRLFFPARDTQIGDLHLWQWPILAGMFGLGIRYSGSGLATDVGDRLRRHSGVITLTTIVTLPAIALAVGVDNVAADAGRFLGGWRPEVMLLVTVEAVLVVFGSLWLLGFAQRNFTGTGVIRAAAARGSFAAFVLQGPVLLMLATALRPFDAPAEVKAPLVAVLGIVLCFGLGWLITRDRSARAPAAR
ncbi:MAG: acyltransferase family protein [Actinophytocola sp.]|nr:acyltransferase family protein [Actinophytocola sp.]